MNKTNETESLMHEWISIVAFLSKINKISEQAILRHLPVVMREMQVVSDSVLQMGNAH